MTDSARQRRAADAVRLRVLLSRGLAVLWIVSGLLQSQPRLYTQAVMTNVLVPLVERQPIWFQHALLYGDSFWSRHLTIGNLLLTVVEIAVGLLIFKGPRSRSGRLGLWASLGLSIILWYFVEGLGGIITGYASMIYQFPGTVFTYGVLAALLLLPEGVFTNGSVRRGLQIGMGCLWLMAAVLQALPAAGFWGGERLGGLFGDATMVGMEPPFMAMITNSAVTASTFHPAVINFLLVVIMAGLGIAWLLRPTSKVIWWITILWLLLLWVIPEEMGTLLTGLATNPGTAWPLGLAAFAASRSPRVTNADRVSPLSASPASTENPSG